MATFRLTAAGVSDSLRAAPEKLFASALRAKASRFAKDSIARSLQAIVENQTSQYRLILSHSTDHIRFTNTNIGD
jgi:hypothetical protein